MAKWSKEREESTMRFEIKLKMQCTKGNKIAGKPQQGQYQ